MSDFILEVMTKLRINIQQLSPDKQSAPDSEV